MIVCDELTADFNNMGKVLVVNCSNLESSSEYKSAVSNLVNTCLIPFGTSISTPSAFSSALIFPATLTSDFVYRDRNSGVSNADRRTDCRRLIDLVRALLVRCS